MGPFVDGFRVFVAGRESPMLSDIYIPRAKLGHEYVDVHRHATFSCRWSRMIAKVRRLFG